jgi:predicted membrane protein
MERNDATFFGLFHSSIEKGVLVSLTRFIKNVMEAKMESIFAVAAALLVLFTAMMDPYTSVGVAVTLLVALGTYKSVKRQKQERGYLNG